MRSGEWVAGFQLPTLDDLAKQFGVARVTVRQAMNMLESERLIWRRQGKGTFVSAHAQGRHWMSVASQWDDLIRTIEGTSSQLLSSYDTTNLLRLNAEDGISASEYRFMRRVHSYNGEPHLLIDLYLARDIYDLAPKQFDTTPVLPVMAGLRKVKLGRAHQTVTVSVAEIETAEHLRLSLGAPVVEVHRIVQDQATRIIYSAHLSYRSDTFRLEMKLRP